MTDISCNSIYDREIDTLEMMGIDQSAINKRKGMRINKSCFKDCFNLANLFNSKIAELLDSYIDNCTNRYLISETTGNSGIDYKIIFSEVERFS